MRNIIFQALADAARSSESVALGIITNVHGSSPQKVGAKALFYADGRIKGTMGGGCLEAEIQQRAVQSLRSGQATTFDLLLDHDFGWDHAFETGLPEVPHGFSPARRQSTTKRLASPTFDYPRS